MDFTFTVTDQQKLDGLQKATDAYNADQGTALTLQQYVEFVMNSAMASYAQNYVVQPGIQLAKLQADGVTAIVDPATVDAAPVSTPPLTAQPAV